MSEYIEYAAQIMKRVKAARVRPASGGESKGNAALPSSSGSPRPSTTSGEAAGDADAGGAGAASGTSDGEDKKHNIKAKIFTLKEGAWKSGGIGDFRVMHNEETGKGRVVMYNAAGRLMLNCALYPTIKVTREGKKDIGFLGITDDGPANIRVRVKESTDSDFLKAAMDKWKSRE
jgi:hypothetical protein